MTSAADPNSKDARMHKLYSPIYSHISLKDLQTFLGGFVALK